MEALRLAVRAKLLNHFGVIGGRRKWLFIGLALLIFAPVSVRADAINIPIVLGYGIAVLAPLLAFQTVVEATIVRLFFPVTWRAAAGVMFWANVWSVVAGIPTKILNLWIYDSILPRNLYDYMRLFPAAVVVGSCVYFVVTVLVEWIVARKKLARIGAIANGSRLVAVIAVANVATYAVCAPIFYQITKPHHTIAEFTKDSSWARQPAAEFFYISAETGFLRAARTDGREDRLVAPFKMETYLVSDDRKRCIFRGDDQQFYDCDLTSGRRTVIPGNWERWTRVDEVVLRALGTTNQAVLNGWSGWTQTINWLKTKEWSATAFRGLDASLIVHPNNEKRIVFADNPGWIHLSHRSVGNIAKVNENEILFDDFDSIYLLDIERRRIGFVVHGMKAAIVGHVRNEEEEMEF